MQELDDELVFAGAGGEGAVCDADLPGGLGGLGAVVGEQPGT